MRYPGAIAHFVTVPLHWRTLYGATVVSAPPCSRSRVHEDLREQGEAVSRKRVVRLMQLEGLRARARKRFKSTTMSEHDRPVAANVLDRDFVADAPNQRWVADTSEFVIGSSGKLYLAAVLDLFSRFVVGWAVSAINDGCGSSSSTDFSPVHRLFCSRTVPSVRFARGQAPTGLFSGSQPGLINGAWALRSVPPGPPPGHSRSVLVACRGKGDSSEMAVVTTTRLSGRAFWVALGATSGRGRLDRRRHRAGETLKTVGVCPLVGNAQRRWRES